MPDRRKVWSPVLFGRQTFPFGQCVWLECAVSHNLFHGIEKHIADCCAWTTQDSIRFRVDECITFVVALSCMVKRVHTLPSLWRRPHFHRRQQAWSGLHRFQISVSGFHLFLTLSFIGLKFLKCRGLFKMREFVPESIVTANPSVATTKEYGVLGMSSSEMSFGSGSTMGTWVLLSEVDETVFEMTVCCNACWRKVSTEAVGWTRFDRN